MRLTENEQAFLYDLVKKTLEQVQREEKTILDHPFPKFLAVAEEYEEFLENLLEKLDDR